MNLGFHSPHWLWLLLALPIWAWLVGRFGQRAAITFSSVRLARAVGRPIRSRAGGRVLLALRALGLACLIIALARPQLGKGHSEVQASGIDIMLAVDVSGSMQALDFSENSQQLITRLAIVKHTIEQFIQKRPSDRIGLMVFAKEPYLVSPLTLDLDWLLHNLERVQIGLIDPDGTAIGPVIAEATKRMREQPAKSRIVILLTDGEDNVNRVPPVAAAEAARAYGIKFYTIAAGRSGIVPMPVMNRAGQVVRIERVQSNVDAETMQEVATITGGKFYQATNPKELEAIYNDIDQLEKTKVSLRHYDTYEELFIWPALAGLLLLFAELALACTRLRTLP